MSDVPSLVALAGAVPIAVALGDVFLTLFHPAVAGPIGSAIQRTTWRASQALGRRRPAALAVAAPAGVLLTIAMWASLLVLGWALVYWPFMEGGFRPQTGAELGRPFVAAVYTSGVTLSTLGYGDLAPAAGWLRLLAPVESLLGFGLLTASVSWLLGIYDEDVAFRADMLDRGLEEPAQRLRHGFLPAAGPDAADVLDAYVAHHHAVE